MTHPPDTRQRANAKAEATAWWVRLDSGRYDHSQYRAFQAWLDDDPDHRLAFDEISELWGELDAVKPLLTLPATKHQQSLLGSIVNQLKATHRRHFATWPVALAACCLLIWFSPLGLLLQADFRTGVGEMRSFTLSDGSTVHLNSNSALAVNISANSRHLSLIKGEALFEVSPDKKRPFRVAAGNGTVTALGTAFNIRLGELATEVTVTEHSVAIDLNRGKPPTRLEQGQRLVYGEQRGIGDIQTADISAVTAWQRGKLVFQNQPLGEVVAELNRYHHGYILISDNDIAQRRVNGVFRTDDPGAVVSALQTSLNLNATHIGEYLIVLHR